MGKKNASSPNPDKIDWAQARAFYASTDANLKEVAENFGVSAKTVGVHSRAEGWREARSDYRKKVASDAVHDVAEEERRKTADKLKSLCVIADSLESAMVRAVKDPDQLKRWIVQETTATKKGERCTTSKEKTFEKFDARSLRDLTSATETLARVQRSLHGIFDASEEQRRTVEAERLAMERERLAMERERLELQKQREAKQDSAEAVTIVVGGYQEGYSE